MQTFPVVATNALSNYGELLSSFQDRLKVYAIASPAYCSTCRRFLPTRLLPGHRPLPNKQQRVQRVAILHPSFFPNPIEQLLSFFTFHGLLTLGVGKNKKHNMTRAVPLRTFTMKSLLQHPSHAKKKGMLKLAKQSRPLFLGVFLKTI